jgi:3-oxoacyl-[acyl-carrier protein] reductase
MFEWLNRNCGDEVLANNGRVVLLGSMGRHARFGFIDFDDERRCTQAALGGVVSSLAKELGRRGVTVNGLRCNEEFDASSLWPLSWLVSDRASFVSGQFVDASLSRDLSRRRFVDDEGRDELMAEHDDPEEALFREFLEKNYGNADDGGDEVDEARLDKIDVGRRRGAVVVTGAARGIGEATARMLAESGAYTSLVMVDQPSARLDEAVERAAELAEAAGRNVRVHGVGVDVSDTTQLVDGVLRCTDTGTLSAIVHNAGITRDRLLARMQPSDWRQVLDINLRAIVHANLALEQRDAIERRGRIVMLSSINGIAGAAGQANYAAAKRALIGYAEQLADRLRSASITVNCVAPGFIDTDMTAAMPEGARLVSALSNAMYQSGVPDDIANAIAFLLSDRAKRVTGTTLRVCGAHMVGQ